MEHPDGGPGGGQPVENNPGTPSYLNNPPPANHAGHQLPDRTLIDQIHRKIQDLTGSLQQLVSCPSSTFSGSIEKQVSMRCSIVHYAPFSWRFHGGPLRTDALRS